MVFFNKRIIKNNIPQYKVLKIDKSEYNIQKTKK